MLARLGILTAFSLIPILAMPGRSLMAPCVRPTRAATQVQGEVRICPGRYRIPDRKEEGVIIAAASGTRLDLTGVVLESGDSVASRFVGIGVASRGVDAVAITGGSIHGYRYGIRLEGGRAHRIVGSDISGSRNQGVLSTPAKPDSTDRLDLTLPDSFLRYGGGILLLHTAAASITGNTARHGQNGIALMDVRDSYVADNDVSSNNGWGIHLWRASRNIITRNQADHVRRCEAQVPAGDCNAVALLLRDGSDSNSIVDNDVTASSLGILLAGERRVTRPSVGNLIYRNDASGALKNAFACSFGWGNSFLENRADSSSTGFHLDHCGGTTVRANTIIGARTAAIVSDHGTDNAILANTLIGAPLGIGVGAPGQPSDPSARYRIDDNVLARLQQGIVLQRTTRAQLRGNLFDGVGDGLIIDGDGHASEVTGNVFLRASRWFIDAPDLAAGGNYWATTDAAAATAKVKGRVSVLPWRPASAAGY
jgi:parallel beta-helix repeat protein